MSFCLMPTGALSNGPRRRRLSRGASRHGAPRQHDGGTCPATAVRRGAGAELRAALRGPEGERTVRTRRHHSFARSRVRNLIVPGRRKNWGDRTAVAARPKFPSDPPTPPPSPPIIRSTHALTMAEVTIVPKIAVVASPPHVCGLARAAPRGLLLCRRAEGRRERCPVENLLDVDDAVPRLAQVLARRQAPKNEW